MDISELAFNFADDILKKYGLCVDDSLAIGIIDESLFKKCLMEEIDKVLK